ncbi:NAD(P)/FAD-dependent oxidoreductase [Algoriphagus namhaensis]|uniref:NAD(P)/FAD-dependent oxidoreductase n=1 Tax=Algoriphagus namhaensis TaxID=915353 RepID=A0ABV8AR50_9BACT
MKFDFLLIGHGLAGSILGYRLLQEGQSIRIIDSSVDNTSSRVAAGLYNPITGRKMVKTWMADQLFPEIKPLYQELEKVTRKTFLEEIPIYRPFLTVEEQNEWMGKSAEATFVDYVSQVFQKSKNPAIKDPFGGVMLRNSGWLATAKFLEAMTEFYGDILREEKFDETDLIPEKEGWTYRNDLFKNVIFCNGLGALDSRFFSWLPFSPVKGEILEVSQSFEPSFIVNRGVFRVGLGNRLHRVGSTYTKHDLDQGPTESAKNELIERLDDLINEPIIQIQSHKFGIRPATRDRKPFLGKHPSHQSVYCFNGFGAKGVSLIPYFSKKMTNYILKSEPLEKEVDIARYFNYI